MDLAKIRGAIGTFMDHEPEFASKTGQVFESLGIRQMPINYDAAIVGSLKGFGTLDDTKPEDPSMVPPPTRDIRDFMCLFELSPYAQDVVRQNPGALAAAIARVEVAALSEYLTTPEGTHLTGVLADIKGGPNGNMLWPEDLEGHASKIVPELRKLHGSLEFAKSSPENREFDLTVFVRVPWDVKADYDHEATAMRVTVFVRLIFAWVKWADSHRYPTNPYYFDQRCRCGEGQSTMSDHKGTFRQNLYCPEQRGNSAEYREGHERTFGPSEKPKDGRRRRYVPRALPGGDIVIVEEVEET
jgi:hypothetical protein